MKAAAIDIGTNTVKLIVGESTSDGIKVLAEALQQPRIGQGIDRSHEISSDAVDRAVSSVAALAQIARDHDAREIRVVGTSALRDAKNSSIVAERLRAEVGVDLQILSEDDECRLSYSAVGLDPVLGEYTGLQVVADVGGGSSELTIGEGTRIIGCKSVRLGAVRLTEKRFHSDPVKPDEVASACADAKLILRDAVMEANVSRLVAVGGSAVNIARIIKKIPTGTVDGVHGCSISADELEHLLEKLAAMHHWERRSVVGLDPERADIIAAGALILQAIMRGLNVNEMIISTRGLRHGILYEMLGLKSL